MKNKMTSLHSTFSVNGEISNEDTRFLNVTIDVLHLGKNLNGSIFEKDVVNSCIDSIKNTPVLGFVEYDKLSDEYDFKGHEHVLVNTEDGIEERYFGSAYGFIPESCNPRWVVKMCADGQEREFLQVDAVLWTKFEDSINIIERDIEKSQSMELEVSSVEGYEDEDGVFHFTSFRFDGCCILGSGVQPAMTGANVMVKEVKFAMNDFINNIQSELNDKFSTFTALVNDKSNQGGVMNMSNTDLEQVVETQSVEVEQEVSETEIVETEVAEQEVAETGEFECEEGNIDEVNDNVKTVDMESKFSEMETEIENLKADYAKIKSDYDLMSDAYNQMKSDYEAIKSEYDEIKPKYEEYVQAEAQRQADELNAQKDAKFAEYEDILADNADFIALKERKCEMSVDDIEKECAVLYVRTSRAKNNFSKSTSTSVVTAGISNEDESVADGYVNTKYGNVRIGRQMNLK